MKQKYEPMIKLKVRRIECGLRQADLAEKAGISSVLVSLYERGVIFPRKHTLDALAKALGCDVRDIV